MRGLGLGLGLELRQRSAPSPAPTGSLDPSITPPVLSLAVPFDTYPPELNAALDDTVAVGDAIELQWTSDIRFATIDGTASNTIDSSEATANAASFTGLSSIAAGTNYFRARVVLPSGDFSDWSNTVLHGAAVDETPAAFSLTDVSGATLSTAYESNAVTLSGFNQPVAISVTGGQYAIDSGAGFGAYTSSDGTAYPGDQVKVKQTSSGSNSTATNAVLTVGGVSDTFTVTTEAAAVSLPASGLILRLDADDLTTLFQTVDGSTTAVAADGDPVGYWGDKSGNGFHLSAAGNDTTRPTYKANSGLPYINFDGANDILRRLAALGLWSAGACTVIVALRSTNATQATSNLGIFMAGSNSSNNPVYELGSVGGASDDIGVFFRDDANASITVLANQTVVATGLDANDSVITFTDDGANLIAYDDGTAGPTRTYSRSGHTLTLNRFAIGGWQRGAASSWLAMRVYAVAAWNRVLNSAERAQALSYMGSKQGRLL